MKSFLPTLTSFSRQRVCSRTRWLVLVHARSMSRSAEAHADALAGASAPNPTKSLPPAEPSKRATFQDLGLHPPIVAALHSAFPNVQHPTEAQAKFIPAVLSGKDVLLRDDTGSGKSFGLMVALLNRPRVKPKSSRDKDERRPITSLVVVPHRDLAYQFYHWLERLTSAADPAPALPSVAQVLVRDGQAHLSSGLAQLRAQAPHILIGTPQALLDVHRADAGALQLGRLASVMVDEVDYLVETAPRKEPGRSYRKAAERAGRRLLAHPGATRELLDVVFARRKEAGAGRGEEAGAVVQRRREAGIGGGPQLILSSATLRNHLNDYLFQESGWLNKDHLVKVKGTGNVRVKQEGVVGGGVTHSVLVVSDDGIKNMAGAVPADTHEGLAGEVDPETLFGPSASLEAPQVDPELVEKYADKASPFDPNAFEAVATAFALDVPSVALLVLPSSAPVQRAVYELREMGVNAQGLDLLAADRGKGHLLSGGAGTRENPVLLVSTLATTRGLDLPDLSHVFVLGIPEGPQVSGKAVDAYVHIAGRVGRFGGGGKVVTVVSKGGGEGVSDEMKMGRILGTINVRAVRFEQFD